MHAIGKGIVGQYEGDQPRGDSSSVYRQRNGGAMWGASHGGTVVQAIGNGGTSHGRMVEQCGGPAMEGW